VGHKNTTERAWPVVASFKACYLSTYIFECKVSTQIRCCYVISNSRASCHLSVDVRMFGQLVSETSLEGKSQPRFTTGRWNPHHNCVQIATANDTCIRGWDLRTLQLVHLQFFLIFRPSTDN